MGVTAVGTWKYNHPLAFGVHHVKWQEILISLQMNYIELDYETLQEKSMKSNLC